MIQLLFVLLFAEASLVLTMIVKTPLQKLAIIGLDRVKRGRGTTIVKTIAGTFFVVLMSSIYSMSKIRRRSLEFGSMTPTDQVLMSRHLLEASLMGFVMFLGLIIDRLHHYLREFRMQRKNFEALRAQQSKESEDGRGRGSDSKALQSQRIKDGKDEGSEGWKTSKAYETPKLKANIRQVKSEAMASTYYPRDIACMKTQVEELLSEIDEKEKEKKTADFNTLALEKQLEGIRLEYDRLSRENMDIADQLKSKDPKHTAGKKYL